MKIYWANSMFTEAQLDFNAKWAARLRASGYSVTLPQEFAANAADHAPTASEIFFGDTAELLASDVMVAVIDDETIDSGVATELGIAYAHGIPIVGVYTDFRRLRASPMYKNLYPLGALNAPGGLVADCDQLLAALGDIEGRAAISDWTVGLDPDEYERHVFDLASSYQPPWSVADELDLVRPGWRRATIVDFGCGTGVTCRELKAAGFEGVYIGFDLDEAAVREAAHQHREERFISSVEGLATLDLPPEGPTIVLVAFVLHDVGDLSALRRMVALLPKPLDVLVCDLEKGDLPGLSALVERATGRAYRPARDHRLTAGSVTELAGALGLADLTISSRALAVNFADAAAVLRHVDLFRVLEGADLGIPAPVDVPAARHALGQLLEAVDIPLADSRHFLVATGSIDEAVAP
jgi:SAM-dependent methyltransferase